MSNTSTNNTYTINIVGDAFTQINVLKTSFRELNQAGNAIKFIGLTALTNALQSAGQEFGKISLAGGEFEQQIADLSAITGIAGKDLESLAQTSREVGEQSGLGAAQAAEAFKLLASNIDVSKIGIEGLKELQTQTIKLAQASGVDMPTAANTMAASINQFGLQASDAAKVIDILAAGAKFGAAEVPDLSESLKIAGSTAANAGVNMQSAVGALEILSQNALKGSEAGTGLRNVMLKLQTEGIPGVDLKTKGLSASLKQLQPILGNTSALAKIFGMENINAAQILIKNADAVDEMTKKVDENGVASEQAAIRTDTYKGSVARIQATIDDYKISMFNLTGSFLPTLEVLGSFGQSLSSLIPLVSGAISLFNWMAASEKLAAFWTGITTSSVWALGAALLANPLTWVVAGVMALVYALKLLYDQNELLTEQSNKASNENIANAKAREIEEVNKLTASYEKLGYKKEKALAKAIESERETSQGELTRINKRIAEATGAGEKTDTLERMKTGIVTRIATLNDKSNFLKADTGADVKAAAYDPKLAAMMSPKKTKGAGSEASGMSSATEGRASVRNIKTDIHNLVGTINLYVSGVKEGTADIRKQVAEALVGSTRDFEVAISNG